MMMTTAARDRAQAGCSAPSTSCFSTLKSNCKSILPKCAPFREIHYASVAWLRPSPCPSWPQFMAGVTGNLAHIGTTSGTVWIAGAGLAGCASASSEMSEMPLRLHQRSHPEAPSAEGTAALLRAGQPANAQTSHE